MLRYLDHSAITYVYTTWFTVQYTRLCSGTFIKKGTLSFNNGKMAERSKAPG